MPMAWTRPSNINIGNVGQLEELLTHMSDQAKRRAEEKIKLSHRIESLKNEQMQMFA
jgi:hypothetical protein